MSPFLDSSGLCFDGTPVTLRRYLTRLSRKSRFERFAGVGRLVVGRLAVFVCPLRPVSPA